MEDVLSVYQQNYSEQTPLVCMDETSKQLTIETRNPIPANSNHVEYFDTEYERNGTASLFMFFNPIDGKRRVAVTGSRTAKDWAHQIKQLVDVDYPDAKKITLVMDNLNTHTKGAFYEAFEPEIARAYLRRLEFCYTPKHGSWLNVAECELSGMTSQCLQGRRIGELDQLQSELAIWSEKTNAKQRGVDWQFKIDDARRKLKRLYPKIKT